MANAPVFLDAVKAVEKIVEELFNDKTSPRPNIKASIYQNRELVRKIYDELGDAKSVLPVIGIKPGTIALLPDGWYNPFVLKNDGLKLAEDQDGGIYMFKGVQVEMQFTLTLFTDAFEHVLWVMTQVLLLKSELHFGLRAEPGIIFPNTVKIDKTGFNFPELNMESGVISNFEFEFQMTVHSWNGNIVKTPKTKEIKLGGGPMMIMEDGKKLVETDVLDFTLVLTEE